MTEWGSGPTHGAAPPRSCPTLYLSVVVGCVLQFFLGEWICIGILCTFVVMNAMPRKLLMYALQNRADDFINEFENGSLQGAIKDCYATESLCRYVYAAKVLLVDDRWLGKYKELMPVVRANNLRIWQYLRDKCLIPDSYHEDLIKEGLQWAWADKTDSYEDVFDASLDDLLQWGANKIDCDLYIAVQQLDFAMTETLLKQGANPKAKICNYNSKESFSAIGHAEMLWLDAYESCGDIHIIWERGLTGEDVEPTDTTLPQLVISATHKLIYDLLSHYCQV
jgi:hypothetical protein